MKFYTKHFLIILNYYYDFFCIILFFKKKRKNYSFIRNFLKKIIFSIFKKFKYILYGYKLILILNFSFNDNRYYKFIKFNFILFYLEIILIFNKIFFFLK